MANDIKSQAHHRYPADSRVSPQSLSSMERVIVIVRRQPAAALGLNYERRQLAVTCDVRHVT